MAVYAAEISYRNEPGRVSQVELSGMDTSLVDWAEIPFVRLVMLSLRVLVLPLVMAAVLLLALAPESAADNAIETVDSYVVVSGDTLWEIAALSTDAGDDVRETIDEINELNGLSSGTLQPGQVLLVPSSD